MSHPQANRPSARSLILKHSKARYIAVNGTSFGSAKTTRHKDGALHDQARLMQANHLR
ncbi:hypothetical protein [Pseudomonas sp. LP_4_YM]|uniref:hypothetical protein n=1 Tax=Pseudomonas sp. LP_4_YM TaxID=2485135 RepID=UPI0010D4224B|nr:hypothetical protein [Pseudomonas sp. LP_4_YM]TCT82920.1 hypothetical protein EC913_16025 [Pseudomonas sp. LP_4_YM]